MPKPDARGIERYLIEAPALLSLANGEAMQEPFVVKTKNISSGGAFLITDKPVPLGTSVKVDLVLSIKKDDKLGKIKTHIDVSGAVIRKEDQGIAVCFNKNYKISPVVLS